MAESRRVQRAERLLWLAMFFGLGMMPPFLELSAEAQTEESLKPAAESPESRESRVQSRESKASSLQPPAASLQGLRSPSIDELLGRGGRKRHAGRCEQRRVGGKVYPWKTYVDWGRELFFQGQVLQSPLGPGPSELISPFYRCTDCHNNQREDRILTRQNPQVRAEMIRDRPRIRPGDHPLFLAPGTTIWGAVNRESFYNDTYEIYHSLPLARDLQMDPTSLEDAIQICCTYCSVGRLAEPWEIDSLLAYFWELEVRLDDLKLPGAVKLAIKSTLRHPEASGPEEVSETRELLRRLYLHRAGDTYTHPPLISGDDEVLEYPDKVAFLGDRDEGRFLYQAACATCHGQGKVNESEGADLFFANPNYFHEIIAYGTEREDKPYMPRFTSQRLSRQQIIDIQTYLQSLR